MKGMFIKPIYKAITRKKKIEYNNILKNSFFPLKATCFGCSKKEKKEKRKNEEKKKKKKEIGSKCQ